MKTKHTIILLLLLITGCCPVKSWITEDIITAGPEFMENVGPISTYHSFNVFVYGWTDGDVWTDHAVHIRCRGWFEILYTMDFSRDVCFHEFCHSYQLNTTGYTDEQSICECVEMLNGKRK